MTETRVIDSSDEKPHSLRVPKMLLVLGYLLFISGQLFRFLHWPFAGIQVFATVPVLLFAIVLAIGLTSKNKLHLKRPWVLLQTASVLLIAYITFRTLHYENMLYGFIIAFLLVGAIIFFTRKSISKHRALVSAIAVLLCLSLYLQIIPRHKMYYAYHIRSLENYEKAGTQVIGSSVRLSYYSYLLYCDKKYDEALLYNSKALKQSEIDVKEADGLFPKEFVDQIKSERNKITERKWDSY